MMLLWRFITKRRTLIYLKYLSFALICCLYFIILFRETITAIEFTKVQRNLHNKNKNEFGHHQKQLTKTATTTTTTTTTTTPTNTKNKYINLFNQRYINKRNRNYSNQQFNNNSITIINTTKTLSTKRSTKIKKKAIKKLVNTISKTDTIITTTTTTPKSIPTTINSIYEYSEELNTLAEKEFNQRKRKLNDICLKYKNITELSPNAWEFFISPGHGIAWCNVFKAASSTWLYYFNILGGYNIGFLQRTRSSPLELARKHFPRPNQYELQDALQQSLSFLIVREPFERLLSAYRNKLEGYRNKYYKILGEKIVKKFRKNKYLKKITLTGPTFKEFLLFLIQNYKNGEHFDEHWTPIYRFCTPCSINYTLIAKVETFQRDSEYIIRQTGLETLLLNKLPKKRKKSITNQSINNTKNLIQRYFSEIDEKILNDLNEIYGPDFELFDYNITKYYDIVKAKQNKQTFNKLLTTTSIKSKTSPWPSTVKLIEKSVSNRTTETIK